MEKELNEHSFDVAINFPEGEHFVTITPNGKGEFEVCEHGKLLGNVRFNEHHLCEQCQGNMEAAIIAQLGDKIEGFYL